MYPAIHAATRPDHPALLMGRSGEVVTYQMLEARSNRLARYLREALGLAVGDHIALVMGNEPRFFEICWAAQRAGLYYTPINWHLSPGDVAAIIADCGARVLFVSAELDELGRALLESTPGVEHRVMVGDPITGHQAYADVTESMGEQPLMEETEGADMLYSSGTTGRPKGIRFPLRGQHPSSPHPMRDQLSDLNALDADTICLVTAPLYHSGPLGFSMRVHRRGGTVVVMERFDAERSLMLIDRHRVTHSHWVPTMFVRLLRLPENVCERYDLSTMKHALHAAGPCPVAIKQQMIEWWGPILEELYGGTERNGLTYITSQEWLEHPGSVGRPIYGEVHIVVDGREVGPEEQGVVYFEGGAPFSYHNDTMRTEESIGPNGWTTLGDRGHVDRDGYLYLSGRQDSIIVSGGINVEPEASLRALLSHPEVIDAATFGVPDDEYGQVLVAAVVPVHPPSGAGLVTELHEHCRRQLAGFQCPRWIAITDSIPRDATGKLRRQALVDLAATLVDGRP